MMGIPPPLQEGSWRGPKGWGVLNQTVNLHQQKNLCSLSFQDLWLFSFWF